MDPFTLEQLNTLLETNKFECPGSKCIADVKQVTTKHEYGPRESYLCQYCAENAYVTFSTHWLTGGDPVVRRPCDMHMVDHAHMMLYKGYLFGVQKCTDDGSIVPFLVNTTYLGAVEHGVVVLNVPTATTYKIVMKPLEEDRMFPFDFRVKIGSKEVTYKHAYHWKECAVDGFTEGGNDSFVFTSFPKDDQERKHDATYCKSNIIYITIIRYKRVVHTPPIDVVGGFEECYDGEIISPAPIRLLTDKEPIRSIISATDTQDTFEELERFTVILQLACIQTDTQMILGNNRDAIQRYFTPNDQIRYLQLERETKAKELEQLDARIEHIQLEKENACQQLDTNVVKLILSGLMKILKSKEDLLAQLG